MPRPLSLRRRLAIYSTLLGLAFSVLLAAAFYFAAHDVSGRLIDETLTAELDDYLARHERNPQSLPPSTSTLHGYVVDKAKTDTLPVYLQNLSPGRYELTVGQASYRVAVADRQGMRYFMLYDESLQQRREGRFIVLLAVGTMVAVLLAGLLGTRLADWVIAPVCGLARRIQNRGSEPGLPPLASEYALDELGELARVFDRHMARIQAFIERERNFTSDLSHELRTALAVILSATEILLEDANLNERQKTRVSRIERAAREMAEMGVALMLMAREENPQQENAPCAVAAVIEEALEKHQHLLKNKPVQIQRQLDPEFYVLADRNLLYIAISNLIRNALVYTEQGEIQVRLQAGTLRITDSGKGIAPAQAEQVFLRYFRSSASEGAGIGLSLVKRIVDLHGWKIRLFPNPQGGTVAELIFSRQVESDVTRPE